jgi:DTW domain-containing protein YfiP
VDPALLALLDDPQWLPCVVFPAEFAAPERVVTGLVSAGVAESAGQAGARPLFILLDGTWSEACKIFRKSPWLNRFPVLSLHPDQLSRYRLRRSLHAHHFCTAEVAALCLAMAGEVHAAQVLEAWLDVFSSRYLRARQSVPADVDDAAHQQLRALVG